jgi:ankyrin repeat protein
VRRALCSLPTELDMVYEARLDRIRLDGRGSKTQLDNLAFTILAWVLYACRPLSLTELFEAVSFEESAFSEDPRHHRHAEYEVLEQCKGLVTVQPGDNTLHFCHSTVRTFLLRHSDVIPSPLSLARTCVSYLLLEDFSTQSAQEDVLLLARHPFLRYSAQHWGDHVRGEGEDDPEILENVKTLFESGPNFDIMFKTRQESVAHVFRYDAGGAIPMRAHLTVVSGLSVVARLLQGAWELRFPMYATDCYGRTLLHVACAGGYAGTVALVTEWDPTLVSKQDHVGCTPLHYAARGGHLDAINILFRHHVDSTVRDHNGRDAFSVAMAWREYDAARLVLDHTLSSDNFSVDARLVDHCFFWTVKGYTILHQAAHIGSVRAIEALLEAGADPHALTDCGQTPVFFAARMGHRDATQLLLKATGSSLQLSRCLDTPLHKAAKRGQTQIVADLLSGDDRLANIRDFIGFAPIHWAAAGGYVEAVELLLPKTVLCIPEEAQVPSPYELAAWGGSTEACAAIVRYYDALGYSCASATISDNLISFLTCLDSATDRIPQDCMRTPGGTRICEFYGQRQLRFGRFRCASAWFDLAILRRSVNANILNPQKIEIKWKTCDACETGPICGLWYWCSLCTEECFDLCQSCFENRLSIGHPHDSYLVSPSWSTPLPSIEECVTLLKAALKLESAFWRE